MTIPLIVLAILSIVGGFIGLPEFLGMGHWLNEYLSPVFRTEASSPDHSTEMVLMAIAVGVAVTMFLAAKNLYLNKGVLPEEREAT